MNIPDPLLRWIESFLTQRQQRVKLGSTFSDWLEIWGTVPQGTLLGVLCFIAMINDLKTDCPTVKYVDDTTIYHTSNVTFDQSLQNAVDTAISWSNKNSMKINASKTKEMFVSFRECPPDVPHLSVTGQEVDRVHECKLLGVYLNDKLNWDTHIDHVYKKACQRIHFIGCLKRTRMTSKDLVKVYTSLVRPIAEYACQVWHAGLTKAQIDVIESIQERVLKIIYPDNDTEEALSLSKLDSLYERREMLSEKLFVAAQHPQHKLFPLMPPLRDTDTSSTRNDYQFVIPLAHTNRYRDTFINHGLNRKW